jgi:hypothetical protein
MDFQDINDIKCNQKWSETAKTIINGLHESGFTIKQSKDALSMLIEDIDRLFKLPPYEDRVKS